MYRVVKPDHTLRPPLTVSNFWSNSFVLGSAVALASTFVTVLTGVTGDAVVDGGFCAAECAAKQIPATAEAARGRSLRFIVPSNTRNLADDSIFKYEAAFEEK